MTGLAPDDIERLHAAARAIRDRAPAQAERLIGEVLGRHAQHAEAQRLQAILFLHTQRAMQAIATLQQAIATHPHDALLHADLGNAYNTRGECDAAIAAWRRAVELDPQQAVPWFNLGRAFHGQGDSNAAVDALQHARALAPEILPAAVLLGDALVHLGHFDGAATHYRDALRLHPACGDAWRGLSNIKTVPLSDADADALSAQLQRRDIADSDRVAMGHALGKLEEDRGRHSQAFAAFLAANALQQRLTPWRLQPFEHYVRQALAATESLPAPIDATLGHEVIFIVGLPRSGSTLFEQILAAHPQVEGASELADLGIVIQQESVRRGVAYPQWVPQASAEDWHRLGRDYLARTAHWRTRRPRFTDKLPDNWKHAGILRAMLPGATVIEVRRDPLETAWSCFKQQFYSQPHFANDMDNIAIYLRDCRQAMDAWRTRDPAHIRLHRYEDLLADPDARIHALLDDCGLDFEPACLQPHQAARAVRTASAAQVRQPIRAGLAHAASYGAMLDPLLQLTGLG
ncbi:tetratricopeptide repeat protein [Thermomonas sp. HDW16]|nr:tetratricopeptide repeat protein [Thermomonas sp. HDW16]